MKKLFENMILIGFASFFVGSVILVFGQLVGLLISKPEFMVSIEQLNKFIFPAASISGLLCFLHPYLFKKVR